MEKRGLDALLVLGRAENNPPMYYFTGGGQTWTEYTADLAAWGGFEVLLRKPEQKDDA